MSDRKTQSFVRDLFAQSVQEIQNAKTKSKIFSLEKSTKKEELAELQEIEKNLKSL